MSKSRPMAIVTKPGKIEFLDRPLPVLGSYDVQVHVKAASICGSDLHIFKGKHPAVALPVPIGHEIAGVVEEIGDEVTRVKPGDRVTIEPVVVCGVCYFCQRGQYHLCTDISFQYRQGQGGFTPQFVAQEKWVHRLPEGLSFEEGALVEPLSVAVHALKKSKIVFGNHSAIFGAGAIGLFLLQLIRMAGGGDVYVVDIQEFRLQTAAKLGASDVFNNRSTEVIAEIVERTGGLGVDLAFEAVGLELTLVQSLKVLKKGGMAILVGLFEKAEVSIPANIFVQKEITLAGSQGYCWDFEDALKILEDRRLVLKPMITHEFALAHIQDSFELLMQPGNEAIKVVVLID